MRSIYQPGCHWVNDPIKLGYFIKRLFLKDKKSKNPQGEK
jgi:hypothetical protein